MESLDDLRPARLPSSISPHDRSLLDNGINPLFEPQALENELWKTVILDSGFSLLNEVFWETIDSAVRIVPIAGPLTSHTCKLIYHRATVNRHN